MRKAATSPTTVVTVLDHAAKLNKEIGRGDAAGTAPTIIKFYTNVNMLALRAAAHRRRRCPGPPKRPGLRFAGEVDHAPTLGQLAKKCP